MSETSLMIDLAALQGVNDEIKLYLSELRKCYDDCVKTVKSCGNDWKDDDYKFLVETLNAISADLDVLESGAKEVGDIVEKKIEAVHQLHTLKIQ